MLKYVIGKREHTIPFGELQTGSLFAFPTQGPNSVRIKISPGKYRDVWPVPGEQDRRTATGRQVVVVRKAY